MKIYCFSGLGADKRAFQFLDLSPHELIHVDWIEPHANESLASYAQRMGQEVNQNEDYVLMGLSFGGMIVQELAQIVQAKKVIVISSIATEKEKPLRMRLTKALKLYDFVPDRYFIQPSKIAFKMFGVNTQAEKELLIEILQDGDPKFIRWAIAAIGNWSNTARVPAFRIHGDSDPLFPVRNVQPDYIVKGGSHLMVVSHSKEIQTQILNYLSF